MSSLVLCSACRRHVRLGAETCPFCSASVAGARAEGPPKNRGLSRARMFAKAAALATGVAACGSSSTETSSTDAAGDATSDSVASDTKSDGSVADAGADAATDTAVDTSVPETPCCPPYGCVFPDAACDGALV